ncbi:hypothetical protein [Catellatospora citrea]|uniref:Uncharacterized protein n=1 Tax=Catellatospora citrea TaxID=53366 RepID=A0A8J3NYL6_9ACTN|nr:hypothetical protein [Catellatospora citrea]RKE07310.1 hypothetical protein C8E86_2136 [Catellatospora citrea]GIF95465.1 hypothetical protein Cci01nite_05590 [Catellatospora citrea]
MRRLLGLLLIAYGFLLAVNTTFPLLADLGGEKVTAGITGDEWSCQQDLLAPPYAGIYGNCELSWVIGPLRDSGRVVGPGVAAAVEANKTAVPAAAITGMEGYAFLPPTGLERIAGFAAPLVIVFGLVLLFAPRKRRRRGHGHSHGDHDHDDDDYDGDDNDSGDSGDSGGDGGGDGGGGGD